VVVTALSYGLTAYALEMVIRVLVLELIPLTAALFVAMRCTIPNGARLAQLRQSGHLDALRRRGVDPVRMELLPRVVAHPLIRIDLKKLLKVYQRCYPGAMFSGCGGGYLIVASREKVPGSLQVQVRTE